jgi:outer membrane autotransporter protein
VPWATALPGLLRAGALDIVSNLHKRMGDDLELLDRPDVEHNDRGWGRAFGGNIRQRQDNVTTPYARGEEWGLQGGMDLYTTVEADGTRQHNVGLYGSYLYADVTVRGMTGAQANPAVVGRLTPETLALGAYWTYKQGPAGFYLDAIAQRSWFRGDGEAVTGVRSDIDGTGTLGSLEIGYGFDLSKTWMLEPQAQVIRQGINLDSFNIPHADISYPSSWSTVGRLGVRLRGDYLTADQKEVKPYVRVNLWRGFNDTQRTEFRTLAATTPIVTDIGYTSAELGGGLSMSVSERFSVYAEVDHLFSLDDDDETQEKGTSGSLGFRYYW